MILTESSGSQTGSSSADSSDMFSSEISSDDEDDEILGSRNPFDFFFLKSFSKSDPDSSPRRAANLSFSSSKKNFLGVRKNVIGTK